MNNKKLNRNQQQQQQQQQQPPQPQPQQQGGSNQIGPHHSFSSQQLHHINQHPSYNGYQQYPFPLVPLSVFDEDPGIMSEVETSATGFRRSTKARSSLPIVRTPSKTQDRSLGLVFLQYRNETKRALLPNEITSIDTVRALFVRSFPRQLTMDYLDSRQVRIYIHDTSKNMFYELEDLADIRDRSVLRVYEQNEAGGPWLPVGTVRPPERAKPYPGPPLVNNAPPKPQRSFQANMMAGNSGPNGGAAPPPPSRTPQSSGLTMVPPGRSPSTSSNLGVSSTPVIHPYTNRPLPERPYSVAGHYPTPDRRSFSESPYSGYLSSPERRLPNGENLPLGARSSFPSPGYSHQPPPPQPPINSYDDMYGTTGGHHPSRSGSATPIIDEEARIRVDFMERQLASLTGLVQKALSTPPPAQIRQAPGSGPDLKGVDKPGVPKPAPPPKPATLANYRGSADGVSSTLPVDMYNQLRQLKKRTKDIRLELRNLRRIAQTQSGMAKETLKETCSKIRTSLAHLMLNDPLERSLRFNRLRLSKDEESYKFDVTRLEKDLNELESQVEGLRSNVINRRCRVNMTDVEAMALILSRASKTVADLKTRYPHLQEALKTIITHEMEIVVREEKFLTEEPDRLENALRRCKKLTGTLVTLKRLASVQEQRCTSGNQSIGKFEKAISADSNDGHSSKEPIMSKRSTELESHTVIQVTPATPTTKTDPSNENTLDALLNELQTFSKPLPMHQANKQSTNHLASDRQRRLGSVDSGRKSVPIPPPRSSSSQVNDGPEVKPRSSLTNNNITNNKNAINSNRSLTTGRIGASVVRSNSEPTPSQLAQLRPKSTPPEGESLHNHDSNTLGVDGDLEGLSMVPSNSTTSLSSIDSQGSIIETGKSGKSRQQLLEERHLELLRKQKLLQEQYTRLQQLSRGELPNLLLNDLKKTGSESNIVLKSASSSNVSGSLTHLPNNKKPHSGQQQPLSAPQQSTPKGSQESRSSNQGENQKDQSISKGDQNSKGPIKHETQKIYETDIL
ncbi:coiled-coil domain-containing protein AGAP005037-like isoform X2 [Panonychus citri]|uniref:coiled-coil domain-containing protein AGAP005037-like isoform X2 n=1 Tax=Panonychus citri TaxID=50023 RepID=UPI002307ED81|nr:coiled-coil domain-containing protein AGAP005037-like isoform X2 [Panonychus citri]